MWLNQAPGNRVWCIHWTGTPGDGLGVRVGPVFDRRQAAADLLRNVKADIPNKAERRHYRIVCYEPRDKA